jgi:HK97 gp10 family phage protein
MGFTVKYNYFGAIAAAMPREIDDGVVEVAEAMTRELKTTLWEDSGMIRRVTTERNVGRFHAEVAIGWYLGHGFYSGFQEFGTRRQAARPIVTPTAHVYEPKYRLEMAEKVKDACDAR